MHITQFAHVKGTPLKFKMGDPVIGNVAHLDQNLYVAVASGQLEGYFQQRMVKNPMGQMEPLSPEIQMGADGKVEMVFSSPLEIQTFQAGSLIEIRPGCAYAFKALSDGLLIEYLVPNAFTKPLLGEALGVITEAPLKDDIPFEILKDSQVENPNAITTAEPAKVNNTPETTGGQTMTSVMPPTQVLSSDTPSPEPLPQRYFYKEEGTGVIKVMLYAFGLMFLMGLLSSSHNGLMIMFYLGGLLYGSYWLVLEIIQLYKKPFTLGIEEEGLRINNLTYQGLLIPWEAIDRIQMGAISHGRYEVQGELVIEIIPKEASAYGKYLHPLARTWFNYSVTHNVDYSLPTIMIKQSAVTVDLNVLLPQLITKKLAYHYTKIAPQENA